MSRLTQRNYYGKAFVPGYAPRCEDRATCELLCKVAERLALFEDIFLRNGCAIANAVNKEDLDIMLREGML